MARDYFWLGIRRRIGNGQSTSIWADPWLSDDGAFQVFTKRPIYSSFPNTVSDMIDANTDSWNIAALEEWLWPIDKDIILAVPVGGLTTEDRWIWLALYYRTHGRFTVRSCYHTLLSRCQTITGGRPPTGESTSGVTTIHWKLVWNLPIPPKIRIFIWRACSNILPTRAELYRRKIVADPLCRRCGYVPETFLHIIKCFHESQEIWRSPVFCNGNPPLSTWVWMTQLQQSLEPNTFHLAIIIMWKLWDNWNKVMHGEEGSPTSEVISWCFNYLNTYKAAQIRVTDSKENTHPAVWKPPEHGKIKINFDVAFPKEKDYYVLANVARDWQGKCLWWHAKIIQGRPKVVEGEAHAALHAISKEHELGSSAVTLEGDNLQIMTALRERNASEASFGAIIDESLRISSLFNSCNFAFVKRSGNLLAHAIATTSDLGCIGGNVLPLNLAHIA
ncbi:PREDICTED: uncharacterized protein LOC105964912 [Erythranthe guttata]|uniref:uncharacterized protein LOC105964912 n=1 Tax=Erythranthe guttata TaxID=4155 RepID=UPI00064DDB11|nr:PREDICTED: uncharacterized protein LOC105964912 [Erythranthe guttata]|eukprot:XP_012844873.1 PREDICTED: uncharacterized protein LOC105964912 [Erythranthe guttata]